jgi:hypothetical protein
MVVDFVMVALAAPCVVLVLAGYGLLAAASVANLRLGVTRGAPPQWWKSDAPDRAVR